MRQDPPPRRSVLYVPAANGRALAKLEQLACDAVIIDLEDSVAPEAKPEARRAMREFLGRRPAGMEIVVRVNSLAGEWGAADLAAAAQAGADAVLLPKIDGPRELIEANDLLDEAEAADLRIWAMIETPRALLNLGPIAELGRDPSARLACLVAGTNDLAKETGVRATPDRRYLLPWLLQIVTAARAGGLDALDGVSNDFRDLDAFAAECDQAAALGFDGKTLIHPAQIEAANRAFSPPDALIAEAEAIVAAFARPENAGRGVIALDGRMVERLHRDQAESLLAKAARIGKAR